MKPHRLAVTNSLVFNYKLHEHMKVGQAIIKFQEVKDLEKSLQPI